MIDPFGMPSVDMPYLSELTNGELQRRIIERDALADRLDVLWYRAADGTARSRKLLHVGKLVRNEVARCHDECVRRGFRVSTGTLRGG